MKYKLFFTAVSALLVTAGCGPQSANNSYSNGAANQRSSNGTTAGGANTNPSPIATQPAAPSMGEGFFKNAAIGGMAEVEFSKEILKTTQNAEVKKLRK